MDENALECDSAASRDFVLPESCELSICQTCELLIRNMSGKRLRALPTSLSQSFPLPADLASAFSKC